jgi:hypothetical protein
MNLENDQLASLFIALYTIASFWSIERGDFRFLQGTEAGGVAASVGYMFSSCFLFRPREFDWEVLRDIAYSEGIGLG